MKINEALLNVLQIDIEKCIFLMYNFIEKCTKYCVKNIEKCKNSEFRRVLYAL